MARRRSSFGSVEKLKSGRFRARYKIEGEWHSAPMTFDSVTDARVFLDGVRTDLTRGAWKAPRRVKYTLGEYGAQWIAQRKVKESTRVEYESTWRNHVEPYLGTLKLDKVTPELVRQWNAQTAERLRAELEQKLEQHLAREQYLQERARQRGQERIPKPPSVATVRDGSATTARAYRLLRSIMQTAVEDDLITKNPCRVKGAGSARSAERPILSLQEVEALQELVPARMAALVSLLAFSGLRIGEAAALQRADIDLHSEFPSVTVRERVYRTRGNFDYDTPKSRAGLRTVVLPRTLLPDLQAHLERYTDSSPTALVFTTAKGGNIYNSYHRYFRRALDAIGRQDVRTHDARHTGMTLAAQSGAGLPDLMQRMGHSNPEVSVNYMRSTNDQQRRVAVNMERLAEDKGNVIPIHSRKAKSKSA